MRPRGSDLFTSDLGWVESAVASAESAATFGPRIHAGLQGRHYGGRMLSSGFAI
ncbi:hypothetical protein NKI36_18920 [Mesorhizobium caraganae]|uniref:Uncharacterized protein n=1 Tax=Mesorhizobium caraganae TaxID=483206 RepID=A0ABV1Z289_9HYPH